MPLLKLAINLRSLRLPFKQALRVCAGWRVPAVEIDARGELDPQQLSQTGWRHVRKLLEDHELRVSAVEFRTRRGYYTADDLVRRVEATKAAMRMAHELGAAYVVNQVGRVPDDPEGADWRLLVDVLSDLGQFGQHVGAQLAAETGTESGADLRRLLVALPPGALSVTLNPGNLILNGFAPLEAIEALASDIGYVHVKDGVYDRARGRGTEVQLGRGSVDFPAVLGALEERGYRGYFCLDRDQSPDPVADVALGVEYLRSL